MKSEQAKVEKYGTKEFEVSSHGHGSIYADQLK